jgi:hypothetical protein
MSTFCFSVLERSYLPKMGSVMVMEKVMVKVMVVVVVMLPAEDGVGSSQNGGARVQRGLSQ